MNSLSTLTVLCYHRVLPDLRTPLARLYSLRGLAVSVETFARQMASARANCNVISLDDAIDAVENNRHLPPRSLLVTFDDGYRDFLDFAVPVLSAFGIPSVQFARVPEADGLPSWAPLDWLRMVLVQARATSALAAEYLTGEARESLVRATYEDQIREVARIADTLGVDAVAADRAVVYARDSELTALAPHNVAIGSHGTQHERWTLLSECAVESVLTTSKAWLDAKRARHVLAWPDGAVNAQVTTIARRLGFHVGFALHDVPGAVSGPLAVPRVLVPDEPECINSLVTIASKESA